MAANREKLIQSIRQRSGRSGVLTADRYFRAIENCFNGGFCPTKIFSGSSPEQWQKALKESENKLTYCGARKNIDRKSFKDAETGKGLATFDAVITSSKRDRDRDVLDTKGAKVDPQMPLLFGHVPMQPIGKMLAVTKHTDSLLKARFVLADTDLANDVLKLMEVGALRISHGFDPIDYEPLDDDEGWMFKSFEIYEASVVSIPSNTDAVIEQYSRQKFKNEFVREWARKSFDERPVIVQGGTVTVTEKIGDYEWTISAPTAEEVSRMRSSVDRGKLSCTCHEKAVVPYKATAKADQGKAWDGDSAVDSLRAWAKGSDSELDLTKAEHRDRYKQGFTVVTGDGTNLGDYHLPHHEVSGGSLEVVFRGVSAAMGALNGARGGTNLSESDQAGARSHLAKHYRQFGQEPPKDTEVPETKAGGQLMCPECGYTGPMSDFEPDMGDPDEMAEGERSFSEIAKEFIDRAAFAPVTEVETVVLSLRGVLDQAEARREDVAWQETFSELGLE